MGRQTAFSAAAFKCVVLMSGCLVLGACGHRSGADIQRPANAPALPTGALAPKIPAYVMVTEDDITNRPYVTLGDIKVTIAKWTIFDRDPTTGDLNKKLQEEAAKLGADAVVLARYGAVGISALSYGEREGRGRAVAFTK